MLLAESGRRGEAMSLLLSMIEQSGADATLGKKAADIVRQIGLPEQIESAYAALTVHFPADAGLWMELGNARYATSKDTAALEAYRRALAADAVNLDAQNAVARMEDVLALDPTPRGLAFRERSSRWDKILQRMLAATEMCTASSEVDKAKTLLKQRAVSLDALDQRMAAALSLWKQAEDSCKTDAVLGHIMVKLGE
jgi:tetratricopeptide (TPR) repeat protein